MRRIIVVLLCALLMVSAIAIIPKTIATVTNEPLWTKKASYSHPDDECLVYMTSISGDGNYVAASCWCGYRDTTGYLKLYDKNGDLLWSKTKGGDKVYDVSVSSNGNYILSTWSDDDIIMMDKSGSKVWGYNIEDLSCIAMSSDGRKVVMGTYYGDWDTEGDSTIYFLENGVQKWKYDTHGGLEDVAISSDGNYIVVGVAERFLNSDPWYDTSEDANSVLFFNRNGNLLWSYKHIKAIVYVSISNDGNTIAATGDDSKIFAFNKNGDELWSFDKKGNVMVSADGSLIVSLSVWGMHIFDENGNVLGNNSICSWIGIDDLAVSSNGDYIAVSGLHSTESTKNIPHLFLLSKNGTIMWEYTPKTESTQEGIRISISSNGNYISGGYGNSICLFDKSILTQEEDKDKGFIPEFEVLYILIILSICALLQKRRKK